MSTDLDIFQQGGTAVSTRNRRDDGFTNNIGSTITSRSISIVNNKFRLMVNGKEISKTDQGFIDVVIVNAAPDVNRMYYSESYDPKAQKRPLPQCWSHDSRTPDPQARNKQADTCAACPQNIAGSGPGKTKACRFHRYIAVVLADDLNGDIYRVKLSATSVFGDGTDARRPFNAYRDYLVANNEGLGSVVSRVTAGEDTSNMGFKAIARLTDEEMDICAAKRQTEEAVRAITLSVASDKHDEDGNEFSPSTPAPRPATREPIVDNEAEDIIPEPVKRSAVEPKPAPVPPPAPTKIDSGDVSLDDLVADWT